MGAPFNTDSKMSLRKGFYVTFSSGLSNEERVKLNNLIGVKFPIKKLRTGFGRLGTDYM